MRYIILVPLFVALLLGAFATPTTHLPVSAQTEGTLMVDAGEVIGPISPYVYGSNFGPLNVIPVDLIEAAQNSGVSFLRFPGGRWGDLNDVRLQQIDDFMRVCRIVGAEPSIHVRLENGTPEAAAELVRYTNIEKEYGVKYWAIGNEPTLFDDYTTEQHNRDWRAIAEAMLEVDPDIILMGPDPHQYNGMVMPDTLDPEGRDFVREFLIANGDLIDILSVHRYPFPANAGNPVTTIDELRENATEWDIILPTLQTMAQELTGRDDIKVAMTEASSHWSNNIRGEATPDSHFSAIWWSDVLGQLIHDQAFIVGYFDFQSADRGGWGLLDRFEVRPTYYVYQLYQQWGTELVFSETSVDYLSVYAALREDGALTLMVVNLADEEQSAPLEINNFTFSGEAEVWRLDLEHNAEQLDSEDLSSGEITVPGQSTTLYVLQP